jgi:hypothetical protein
MKMQIIQSLAGKGDEMSENVSSNEVTGLIETLTQFMNYATVDRQPSSAGNVCGDGGVPGLLKTTKGKDIEVAGLAGDLGQDTASLLALLTYYKQNNIEYELEGTVRAFVTASVETHGNFMYHTSHHVNPPGKPTDCGDVYGKMQDEFAEAYGVDPEETRQVLAMLRQLSDEDPDNVIEQDLGDRNHNELGVLVSVGEQKTVKHWLTTEEHPDAPEAAVGMWFVIDPEQAKQRRDATLSAMGLGDSEREEVHVIKGNQDQVTNSRLAVGLHVFRINADTGEKTYVGTVQKDGSVS